MSEKTETPEGWTPFGLEEEAAGVLRPRSVAFAAAVAEVIALVAAAGLDVAVAAAAALVIVSLVPVAAVVVVVIAVVAVVVAFDREKSV